MDTTDFQRRVDPLQSHSRYIYLDRKLIPEIGYAVVKHIPDLQIGFDDSISERNHRQWCRQAGRYVKRILSPIDRAIRSNNDGTHILPLILLLQIRHAFTQITGLIIEQPLIYLLHFFPKTQPMHHIFFRKPFTELLKTFEILTGIRTGQC